MQTPRTQVKALKILSLRKLTGQRNTCPRCVAFAVRIEPSPSFVGAGSTTILTIDSAQRQIYPNKGGKNKGGRGTWGESGIGRDKVCVTLRVTRRGSANAPLGLCEHALSIQRSYELYPEFESSHRRICWPESMKAEIMLLLLLETWAWASEQRTRHW